MMKVKIILINFLLLLLAHLIITVKNQMSWKQRIAKNIHWVVFVLVCLIIFFIICFNCHIEQSTYYQEPTCVFWSQHDVNMQSFLSDNKILELKKCWKMSSLFNRHDHLFCECQKSLPSLCNHLWFIDF